ncbi:brefeldin A resistance protein [Diplocarpon mali]|nr:brefeldin A resistance protein [Diplocarpon mali]
MQDEEPVRGGKELSDTVPTISDAVKKEPAASSPPDDHTERTVETDAVELRKESEHKLLKLVEDHEDVTSTTPRGPVTGDAPAEGGSSSSPPDEHIEESEPEQAKSHRDLDRTPLGLVQVDRNSEEHTALAQVDSSSEEPTALAQVDSNSEEPTALVQVDSSSEEPTALAQVDSNSEEPTALVQVDSSSEEPTALAQVDSNSEEPTALVQVDSSSEEHTGPVTGNRLAEGTGASSASASIHVENTESNKPESHLGSEPTLSSLLEDHGSTTEESHAKLEDYLNREKASGATPQELGITWRDLTVTGVSSDAAIHENFASQFDVSRKLQRAKRSPADRVILNKTHGCVKPGEMLLVLGKPGSGCTTLLSLLANRRRGYESISGEVHYGSMDHKAAKRYMGQIVMNTERELFFPSLTVGQTLDFATRLKVPWNKPKNEKETSRKEYRDVLLQALGIEHTLNTKIGDEFTRGVSGGERKRVSIAECLATRASIFCWDNSTRGLDASTALQHIKALQVLTKIRGLSTIVTLYQPGNGIYDLFDKVLLLDQGQQIFFGPTQDARPFMEGLGFECLPGANTADYLTGVTMPNEREVRPECIATFPRSIKTLRDVYEESDIYQQMVAQYDYPTTVEAREATATFQRSIAAESCGDSFTVGFLAQVEACLIRQYQILWGDKKTFLMKQISSAALALILGSLFYDAPDNSAGLFVKSGALFFALLYNTLIAMSEVADSFHGRPVHLKHRYFAFTRLAAYHIAQIIADMPVIAFRITNFSVVLYFMVGLKHSGSAFFTYWAMTALFRAIGAMSSTFDGASKWAGICIGFTNLYTGYMLNYHQMHPWFVWVFWVNPLAYAFDGLLSNELHANQIDCVGANLVPLGPAYRDARYQSCAGIGAASVQGQTSFVGDQYLESLTYNHRHVWRNFAILWPIWAFFASVTIFYSTRWHFSSEGQANLLIPREKAADILRSSPIDEETATRDPEKTPQLRGGDDEVLSNLERPRRVAKDEDAPSHDLEKPAAFSGDEASSARDDGTSSTSDKSIVHDGEVARNTSLFTWKDLSYTVKTPDGDRVLLENVHGWVKPGMLGALMGVSGAGKTTLLDVLAQRKTEGIISGSILVDGKPLPVSFERCIGFCEQVDVHEPFATVREALEFSSLLRQDRAVSREEKISYVQTIIDLLELNEIADTLIGRLDAGLNLEQRKRVTIGVELVAKPKVLIFLDEPTSGADSQSAFNTIRFLRKLADVGQAVLVTIHQPSAQVFSQFDTLLLLGNGGKVAYFGDTGGKNAPTVKNFFVKNGAPGCPLDTNPAEYIIDVVSSSWGREKDWNKVWLESSEYVAVAKELDRLESEAIARSRDSPISAQYHDEYASPLWEQMRMVTYRTSLSLWRNTGYVNNKMILHISSALFNGFSFWMVGDSVSDLHSRLFTVFNFIFIAPGALNQLQPLFIERRDIFETREAKSKIYSWFAFATAVVASEVPYLCVCAVLYFVCWYWTVGFPMHGAGPTLFVMVMYEFVFTGIGEFVAACAPSAAFAAFASPVLIGVLAPFCGILVPYDQIVGFWRYWLYYLNPFTYLMGSMLIFDIWGTEVTCSESEFALFDPPSGSTCGEYLQAYLKTAGRGSSLDNPEDIAGCRVCQFGDGSDFLRTLNLTKYYQGWRDALIVVIYALASYAMVFVVLKLRTGRSKKAQWQK